MKFHVVTKESRRAVLELTPSEILRAFVPPGDADRYELVMVKENFQQFKATDGSVLSPATVDAINAAVKSWQEGGEIPDLSAAIPVVAK